MPKLEGAICAIGEHCGVEVANSQALSCDGCGKHLTLARRVTRDGLNCPYCQRRISLQSMVWPEVVLTGYTVVG